MEKLKFRKEPGYTYDLFFMFMLYFNKQEYISRFANHNRIEEETEYYNELLNDYLPVSDDLLLFFYLCDGNRMFLSEWYYDPYKTEFAAEKYSLSVVLAALEDYEQVAENVKAFYFRDHDRAELEGNEEPLVILNQWIKESKYNSEIKSALYAFFIDPVPVIQKLIDELGSKELILAQQYERNLRRLIDLQEGFDYVKLVEGLKQIHRQPLNIDGFEQIEVSFCLNNKDMLFCCSNDTGVVLVLGAEYMGAIRYLSAPDETLKLDEFGTAVSEKNRVEILNLMLGKGEVIVKDIEEELGFTGTNAYYHLMLMLKAGMLKTRNRGRTVLYSINKEYFEKLCNVLKKFVK